MGVFFFFFFRTTSVALAILLLMGYVSAFAVNESPGKFVLTAQEKSYLDNLRNRPVVIAYSYDLVQSEVDGGAYGILDPVLQVLRNEFGLSVNVVKANWHEAFVQIENKSVDFYGPIAISDHRRQKYITVEPFYRSYCKIMTRVNEPIHSMMGLYNRSIGLLEGSVISRTMETYLGPKGQIVYFPTMEHMIEGLKIAKIDAFATVDNAEFEILRHNDIYFEFSIDNFFADQGFIGAREEMRPLAALLTRYLKENPHVSDEIVKVRRQALLKYSRERLAGEFAFLRAKYDEITIYSDMILYPLCYLEDGVIKGMQLEINRVFEELTGIRLRFDTETNYSDSTTSATQKLKTGRCLAIAGAYLDIETWNDAAIQYSPLVWTETIRTYSHKDTQENLRGKTVGAMRFAADYLGWNNTTGNAPILYDDRNELLNDLKTGKIDAVFMGEMGFNYNYTVLGDYSLSEVAGISAQAPLHMLYGAQNREFNALFDESIKLFHILHPQSVGQWKAKSDKYKSDYIRMRYAQQIVAMLIIIVFVIMLAALLYLFGRNRQAYKHTQAALADAQEKRRTIVDSINYASTIQRNLLPHNDVFKKSFADYSIIWSQRDIVGGDIYWIKKFDKGTLLCVCDCTGHGTPGALLSMLVVSAFEAMVNEYNYQDTAQVIWNLEQRLVSVFGASGSMDKTSKSSDIKNGCDLAVLFVSNDTSVTLSSGNTHVFICDGKEVRQIKGQKIFIGEGKITCKDDIKVVKIPANPLNKFYIASDGLYDQVGGADNVPFGYRQFKQIILNNHGETQAVISAKIWEAFESYRGNQARRDDVELITFKP